MNWLAALKTAGIVIVAILTMPLWAPVALIGLALALAFDVAHDVYRSLGGVGDAPES